MTRPVFARGTGTSPAGPAGRDGTNGTDGTDGLPGLPGVNAVANDTATAAYVANPTSATATALSASIDERTGDLITAEVPPLVADLIAEDGTVAAAAAAAVAGNIAGRSLVEATDLRLAQPSTDADIAFAVTDAQDRASWLATRPDGGVPTHSVAAIDAALTPARLIDDTRAARVGKSFVVVDDQDRQSPIALDMNGQLHTDFLAAIAAGLPNVAAYPPGLATAGDSITAGGQGGDLSYGRVLGPLVGLPLFNPSVAGETSTDIACRFGARPPLITLTGNLIPTTTTAVAVTTITPTNGWRTITGGNGAGSVGGPIGVFVGTLAGIPGTLRRSDADGTTWTFTRTSTGSTTQDVPSGTPFYCTGGEAHRTDLWIIQSSFNGGDRLVDTAALVAFIRTKRYLVTSLLTAGTETTGTSANNDALAFNASLLATYGLWSTDGGHYWDMRSFLMSDEAFTLAGISKTTQDNTDIANGTVPTSLRADNVHPNRYGYTAIAKKLADIINTKGWANR